MDFTTNGSVVLMNELEVVRVCDTMTGEQITELTTPIDGNIAVLSFNEDGTHLLAAGLPDGRSVCGRVVHTDFNNTILQGIKKGV